MKKKLQTNHYRLIIRIIILVHWLTPELGRIATIAKGALRPKSAFRGKLDLFYQADFSLNRSQRSELHILREVVVGETYAPLRKDLASLQQASYAAALIEQVTETDTPIPEVYELMLNVLHRIIASPAMPLTIFAFELRLLEISGIAPDLETVKLPLGTRELLKALMRRDWHFLARLKASASQIMDIDHFLHGFLIYHVDRLPKGRHAAIAAAINEHLPGEAAVTIDADGSLVTESFVNPHLHLCKVYTLQMMDEEALTAYQGEGMGKAMNAIELAARVKEKYDEAWIIENVRKAEPQAALYGNTHIRAFADVDRKARLEGVKALIRAREEFKGVVDIQVVAFAQDGWVREPGTRQVNARSHGTRRGRGRRHPMDRIHRRGHSNPRESHLRSCG